MAKHYGFRALEALWISNGGPRSVAPTAAAIALAESGGNPKAHNASGASGLWQILGQVVPGNIYDPNVNARNAVKKYNDARGFSPWVTYETGEYKEHLPPHAKLADMEFHTRKEAEEYGKPGGPQPFNEGVLGIPGASAGEAGKAFGNLPGVHQVVQAGEALGDIATILGDVAKLLLTPQGWLQIGEVGGGIIFIGWGLHHLIQSSTGVDVGAGARHAAVKAAEVAAVVK